MDAIRQTFEELGPESVEMMKIIINKSKVPAVPSPVNDAPKSKAGSDAGAPSLRAIERFFLRLNDSEVAFWRVRPTVNKEPLVPPSVCEGDTLYRNDHHVTPVHVFASLKRMATQWLKKYVDNFGRRTKAVDFDVPTTICQANCFGWLFSEQILHRLRLLMPIHNIRFPPPPKPTPGTSGVIRKRTESKPPFVAKKRQKNNQEAGVEVAPPKGSKRPKELYLYDYPRYVLTPPNEGCGPQDPSQLLPLMASTADVVERHYQSVVDRLLFTNTIARPDPRTCHLNYVAGTEYLPYMLPLQRPSPNEANKKKASSSIKNRLKEVPLEIRDQTTMNAQFVNGLPAFLFETPPETVRIVGVSKQQDLGLGQLPVMVQDGFTEVDGSLSHPQASKAAVVARVDIARKARGSGMMTLSDWMAIVSTEEDALSFSKPLDLLPPTKSKTARRRNTLEAATKRGSAMFSSHLSSDDDDDDEEDDQNENEDHVERPIKKGKADVELVDIFRLDPDSTEDSNEY